MYPISRDCPQVHPDGRMIKHFISNNEEGTAAKAIIEEMDIETEGVNGMDEHETWFDQSVIEQRLGDFTQKKSKLKAGTVATLLELWKEYCICSTNDRLRQPLICFKTLLRYTAKVIFDNRFMNRKVCDAVMKEQLKASIKIVADGFDDDQLLRNVCVGLLPLISEPWSIDRINAVLSASTISDLTDGAIENLFSNEGWLLIESRIEVMEKHEMWRAVANLLHASVIKIKAAYTDNAHKIFLQPEDFHPLYCDWQRYLEYLHAYVLLWFKKEIEDEWSPKLSLQVIRSMKTKFFEEKSAACPFLATLWDIQPKEVLTALAEVLLWSALSKEHQQQDEFVEELLHEWINIGLESSTCDMDYHSRLVQIVKRFLVALSGQDKPVLSVHLYSLAEIILMKDPSNNQVREMFLKVYIRGLTTDINHIEILRSKTPIDSAKLCVENNKLSLRELRLAGFFKNFTSSHSRDFYLTAFCLNPCKELFNILFPAAGSDVAAGTCDNGQTPIVSTSDVRIEPELSDSTITNRTSLETLGISNGLAEDLGLSQALKDDLQTVIFKPRWTAIGHFTQGEKLEKLCKHLLETGGKELIQEKELKYVDPDYDDYIGLPSKYDPNDDGIEKGFRPQERKAAQQKLVAKYMAKNDKGKKVNGVFARKRFTANRKFQKNGNRIKGEIKHWKNRLVKPLKFRPKAKTSVVARRLQSGRKSAQYQYASDKEEFWRTHQYVNQTDSFKKWTEDTDILKLYNVRDAWQFTKFKKFKEIYKKKFPSSATQFLPREFGFVPDPNAYYKNKEATRKVTRANPTGYVLPETPYHLRVYGSGSFEAEFRVNKDKLGQQVTGTKEDVPIVLPEVNLTKSNHFNFPTLADGEWFDCIGLVRNPIPKRDKVSRVKIKRDASILSELANSASKYLSLKKEAMMTKATEAQQRHKSLISSRAPSRKPIIFSDIDFPLPDVDTGVLEEDAHIGEIAEFPVIRRNIILPPAPKSVLDEKLKAIMIEDYGKRLQNNLDSKTYLWKSVMDLDELTDSACTKDISSHNDPSNGRIKVGYVDASRTQGAVTVRRERLGSCSRGRKRAKKSTDEAIDNLFAEVINGGIANAQQCKSQTLEDEDMSTAKDGCYNKIGEFDSNHFLGMPESSLQSSNRCLKDPKDCSQEKSDCEGVSTDLNPLLGTYSNPSELKEKKNTVRIHLPFLFMPQIHKTRELITGRVLDPPRPDRWKIILSEETGNFEKVLDEPEAYGPEYLIEWDEDALLASVEEEEPMDGKFIPDDMWEDNTRDPVVVEEEECALLQVENQQQMTQRKDVIDTKKESQPKIPNKSNGKLDVEDFESNSLKSHFSELGIKPRECAVHIVRLSAAKILKLTSSKETEITEQQVPSPCSSDPDPDPSSQFKRSERIKNKDTRVEYKNGMINKIPINSFEQQPADDAPVSKSTKKVEKLVTSANLNEEIEHCNNTGKVNIGLEKENCLPVAITSAKEKKIKANSKIGDTVIINNSSHQARRTRSRTLKRTTCPSKKVAKKKKRKLSSSKFPRTKPSFSPSFLEERPDELDSESPSDSDSPASEYVPESSDENSELDLGVVESECATNRITNEFQNVKCQSDKRQTSTTTIVGVKQALCIPATVKNGMGSVPKKLVKRQVVQGVNGKTAIGRNGVKNINVAFLPSRPSENLQRPVPRDPLLILEPEMIVLSSDDTDEDNNESESVHRTACVTSPRLVSRQGQYMNSVNSPVRPPLRFTTNYNKSAMLGKKNMNSQRQFSVDSSDNEERIRQLPHVIVEKLTSSHPPKNLLAKSNTSLSEKRKTNKSPLIARTSLTQALPDRESSPSPSPSGVCEMTMEVNEDMEFEPVEFATSSDSEAEGSDEYEELCTRNNHEPNIFVDDDSESDYSDNDEMLPFHIHPENEEQEECILPDNDINFSDNDYTASQNHAEEVLQSIRFKQI